MTLLEPERRLLHLNSSQTFRSLPEAQITLEFQVSYDCTMKDEYCKYYGLDHNVLSLVKSIVDYPMKDSAILLGSN
jgi:hypothetical protein